MASSQTLSTLSAAANSASSVSFSTNNSNAFATNVIANATDTPIVGQTVDPTAAMAAQNAGFPVLNYPLDGGVYFLALVINNYVRPSMLQPLALTGKSIITLPVPNDLVDSQSIVYTPQQLNAAVGVASENLAKQMYGSAGQGNPGQTVGGMTGILGGLAGRFSQGALNTLGGIGSAAAQLLGQAPNPFLTVQFSSPQFRRFAMNWLFSPNTPAESQQLNLIINTLKRHSLPSLNQSTGGLFFNYPDIIMPILYPNSDLMFQFKYCVIENVLVNWAAGGSPSFFAGTKHPTTIQLQLQMMEIELWLSDDAWFQGKSI